MELLDYLIANPAESKSKVNDVELLLVNMHHLLNNYRPHQARQILITLMEEQSKRRRTCIELIDKTLEEAQATLKSLHSTCQEASASPLSTTITTNNSSVLLPHIQTEDHDHAKYDTPQTEFNKHNVLSPIKLHKMVALLDKIDK